MIEKGNFKILYPVAVTYITGEMICLFQVGINHEVQRGKPNEHVKYNSVVAVDCRIIASLNDTHAHI